jgi:predicted transposase/invertase (TIGR01784 family)
MTPQKPFPPRTLAEALDYYAGADYNNAINTAKKDAKEEGRAEGRAEGKAKANMDNARKMKADGMPAELIAKYTSLSIEEIVTL